MTKEGYLHERGRTPKYCASLCRDFLFIFIQVFKLIMDPEFATKASIAIVVLSLTSIISTALFRLFLSPLASIPGPTLAALTSWYEFYYDVIKPGQYVWKIKELHTQYGCITMSLKVVWSN